MTPDISIYPNSVFLTPPRYNFCIHLKLFRIFFFFFLEFSFFLEFWIIRRDGEKIEFLLKIKFANDIYYF